MKHPLGEGPVPCLGNDVSKEVIGEARQSEAGGPCNYESGYLKYSMGHRQEKEISEGNLRCKETDEKSVHKQEEGSENTEENTPTVYQQGGLEVVEEY